MAELQTVAAVLDLMKASYEVGKFLKKVKDADKIALEIGERINRLECVLQGVHAALKHRDDHDISSGPDAQVAVQILDAVISCSKTLRDLRTRVGGFDVPEQQSMSRAFMERVKVALRSSSINRINGDLEARIHILSTELTVLQLFDQTKTSATIETNHGELLDAIATLGTQINDGNEILKRALLQGRFGSAKASNESFVRSSDSAVESLRDCLQTASNVHERFSERYTSDHLADDRSERIKRVIAEQQSDSPFGTSTPSVAIATPSTDRYSLSEDRHTSRPLSVPTFEEEEEEDVWPLEILNVNIQAYADRASTERDIEHFNQAELNLSQAIRNSETRESHYGVPFVDRAKMMEEMSFLLMKQKKWAEAVTTVHQLMRERSPSAVDRHGEIGEDGDLVLARQHQLLASVYYDRYTSNAGAALSHTADDIEKAEIHARRAFTKRWKVFGSGTRQTEGVDEYNQGIALLIRILDARDKTVDAGVLKKLLPEDSSVSSDSIRRISSTQPRPQAEYDLVDKHDILVEAIQSGDVDQIQGLLAAKDLEVERLCKQGKTFLMHAVECKDVSTLNKLLDPEVGAYVDTANRRGLTALHYAAMSGLHEMAQCLLLHDADIKPKDKKDETPIVKAVRAGDLRMVEIFFNHDEETLQTKGGDEWSLLHYAVERPSKEMIALLLDLAPELKDAVDQAGKTPLHHCAEHTRFDQAAALLGHRHAATVNATDSVSRTPLFLAASKPHTPQRESLVSLLVQKGAEIDERRPPLRMRDYTALKPRVPRRDSTLSWASVSTEGTVGTTSTGVSRKSRWLGRMAMR